MFDTMDGTAKDGLALFELDAAFRELCVFRNLKKEKREKKSNAASDGEEAILMRLGIAFTVSDTEFLDYQSFEGLLLCVLNVDSPDILQPMDGPDGEPPWIEIAPPPEILDPLVDELAAMHRVNKHAYGDHHVVRQSVVAEATRDHTYSPAINNMSRKIEALTDQGRADPRHELLYQKAFEEEQRKRVLQQEALEERMQDCTFTPKLSDMVMEHIENSQNSAALPKARLSRAELVALADTSSTLRERDELVECSFQPETNSGQCTKHGLLAPVFIPPSRSFRCLSSAKRCLPSRS